MRNILPDFVKSTNKTEEIENTTVDENSGESATNKSLAIQIETKNEGVVCRRYRTISEREKMEFVCRTIKCLDRCKRYSEGKKMSTPIDKSIIRSFCRGESCL